MSQTFTYAHPGSWSVDLGTQAARLGDFGGYAMDAEAGSVGTSTFIIDDPSGTVGHTSDAILGLQSFYVTESDCAAVGADGVNGQRLYTGYTRERVYRRGDATRGSLITGVARQIEVTLEDPNATAAFRILNNNASTLGGTVTKTAGNTTITGVGTPFLATLGVNYTISIPGGGGTDILYVSAVASDTSLTVYTAPAFSASGVALTRVDADRPAETDVQRVQWLLGGYIAHGGLSPYFLCSNDAGWVDTSGGVAMDACDYTGQTPADVLHDCALASGKNWWVGFWEATGRNSLWYRDSNTSTTYASLLRISNVLADVNGSNTFAPVSAQLRRDPARTLAGVWLPYSAGHVYVSNALTASNYGWRDGSAPTPNVKTLTQALSNANRLLADAATEEDRIDVTVQLPSTLATGIKVGQRISCRFSHLPGYDSFTWLRVVSQTVAQDEATDKRYTLGLSLRPQVRPLCFPDVVQSAHGQDTTAATFATTVTPGNLLVVVTSQESTIPLVGWTLDVSSFTGGAFGGEGVCVYHRIAQPGDGTYFNLHMPSGVAPGVWVATELDCSWTDAGPVTAALGDQVRGTENPVHDTMAVTSTGDATSLLIAGFWDYNVFDMTADVGWFLHGQEPAQTDHARLVMISRLGSGAFIAGVQYGALAFGAHWTAASAVWNRP